MARPRLESFVLLCCLCGFALAKAAEPPGPDGVRFEDGSRLVPFGESCYRIPEWNGRLINAAPLPLHEEPRRDTSYLLLRFQTTEIASRVKGYQRESTSTGKPIESLLIGVSVLTEGSQAQRRFNESRMHLDLLYAGPGYESRVVEPIPGTSLYRLFHSPDRTSWMIATRAPDMRRLNTHEGGDLWFAACTNFAWQRSPSGTCKTDVERGGFSFSFSALESNVLKGEQLADYVLNKLSSWKSSCR